MGPAVFSPWALPSNGLLALMLPIVRKTLIAACVLSLLGAFCGSLQAAPANQEWYVLRKEQLGQGAHHTRHAVLFGPDAPAYNLHVLKGIDKVQSEALSGGGYFIGKDAIPTESPVGYSLSLFGRRLIDPPRVTSYCSGSSYAAFIEAINIALESSSLKLSDDRFEALRMQEPDGSRREDGCKMWGWWNANGFGNDYALVQYSRMGEHVAPREARPGDFLNISWKNGIGHSVVFLGWYLDDDNTKKVVFWSSQPSTNGYGDSWASLGSVKEVLFVRLTCLEALYNFDISQPVKTSIRGDIVDW